LEAPAGVLSGQTREAISILMPAYNEAETIEAVVRGFYKSVATPLHSPILVCEDGSTDGTKDVLNRLSQELPVEVISDERRMGYAGGVKRGLLLTGGDAVFFSDSDGQYDPEDFWKLVKELPGADMVIGCKVKREEPFHRTVLAWGFHVLARTLFGVRLRDMDCGFRIIRRSYVNAVVDSVMSLPYSFWAEFTILGALRGFRIREVPISHHSRLVGGSSIYQIDRLPRIILSQFRGLLSLRRRLLREGRMPRQPAPGVSG
jgi:glycosyltransferase involved in cell wall biosynthesis